MGGGGISPAQRLWRPAICSCRTDRQRVTLSVTWLYFSVLICSHMVGSTTVAPRCHLEIHPQRQSLVMLLGRWPHLVWQSFWCCQSFKKIRYFGATANGNAPNGSNVAEAAEADGTSRTAEALGPWSPPSSLSLSKQYNCQ